MHKMRVGVDLDKSESIEVGADHEHKSVECGESERYTESQRKQRRVWHQRVTGGRPDEREIFMILPVA